MDTDNDTIMHSSEDGFVHVGLTHQPLSIPNVLALVRSPAAGALVMFAGTQSRVPRALEVNAREHQTVNVSYTI